MAFQGGPFDNVNIDAAVEMARHQKELRLPSGTSLWGLNEVSDYWLAIDYGKLRCTSETGESVLVGAPFVLGIMDAISAQPRSFAAVAESDIIARSTYTEAFLAVLETHFALSVEVMAIMSKSLLTLQKQQLGVER